VKKYYFEDLFKKPPPSYSKRTRLVIYLLTALMVAFLIYIGIHQRRMCPETVERGINFRAAIGETISIYVNQDSNWYEIDPSSLK
jgi:hypothetical protein